MAGGSSEAVKCPSGSKTSLPPKLKKVQRQSSQRPRAIRLCRLRLQFPGGGRTVGLGGVSVGLYAEPKDEDADDDEEEDASVTDVDSITDLNPSGSIVSVGTEGQRFLPDVTLEESIPTSVNQCDSNVSVDAEVSSQRVRSSYVGQLPRERPGHRHQ